MACYLTRTGSFLPGNPIENDQIELYLGSLPGEEAIRDQILTANGIRTRHYAQDLDQKASHSVYEMASLAAECCLKSASAGQKTVIPTYLSAGATFSPYSGPGMASIVHSLLALSLPLAGAPLEITSHAGICTSGAAALVGAYRAIQCGDHQCALAIGADHSSELLKSSLIQPIDDRAAYANEIRRSKWFMSVFLRFMLSDGAGAFLLEDKPSCAQSLRIDWTHSQSFAADSELCMTVDTTTRLLSQDISILNKYLLRTAEEAFVTALERNHTRVEEFTAILPHMSSYFFFSRMERIIRKQYKTPPELVPLWSNLATAGNTGAASIFIMLHEYLMQNSVKAGDRILLFIPESGQFNHVLVCLTAV